MMEVSGRTAFITGGANGIGLGIARALAKAGARIAIVDIDAGALEVAAEELAETTDVFSGVLDVRDRDAYSDVADEVSRKLGSVSILVNNAGVAAGSSLDKISYDLWDWGVGINFTGVFNGVRTFVPSMIERGQGGHVVNTASGAGLVAAESGVLYHAAKYGVVGMSEAMHVELAPQNIGVTLLCPGPVATGIIARTRSSQPTVTSDLSHEQRKAAFAKHEKMTRALEAGVSPDTVGEMVLASIRARQLYLHTCEAVKDQFVARHNKIMDAWEYR